MRARNVPRVLFWDTVPAPYGVEQYNALADRRNLDVSVWFCRRTEMDRQWDVHESNWRFAGTYVEDPSGGLTAASRFVHRCTAAAPELIIAPYGERPFVAGHALIKALRIRTALVVEASFDTWVRRTWWKESAKAVLFRSADAAHAGPGAIGYARRYGFSDDRLFLVRQTTDVEHFARAVPAEERRDLRATVGVHGCVFLYVGRFWKPKGLLYLIEAFRLARQMNREISLLLVGDGEHEGELREAARGIGNVVFCPFVQRPELPRYYAAADVFVFPTLGDPHGHVVEEAHAAGLPIITSDAAGDIRRRVIDGETGFVVPAADAGALAHRMLTLAGQPDLRRAMGERGAQRVKRWGHDAYVSEIERLVAGCLALPRRTTIAARGMTAAGHVFSCVAQTAARAFHREFP